MLSILEEIPACVLKKYLTARKTWLVKEPAEQIVTFLPPSLFFIILFFSEKQPILRKPAILFLVKPLQLSS